MTLFKRFLVVTGAVSLGFAGSFSYEKLMAEGAQDSATIYRQLSLFGEAFEQVRDVYVDIPDEKILIEHAIKGMLNGLDPHSDYMTADEFKEMQTSTAGEFGGLGLQFTMEDGLVKVITTIDDTPASRAGLLGGDFITHIDGVSVKGLSSREAANRMRGEIGTDITLQVFRPGDKSKSFEVSITRALIEDSPVTMRLEDKVIYLRLSQFNAKAAEKLQEAIDEAHKNLSESDTQGIIVDLRNNGGGFLDQAVAISDMFLTQGEIVTTRGREASQIERHAASSGDVAADKPVIVLINGGSASASEIVAGALQDHKRATLIGTRSFGKGSVQRVIPIDQGLNGALRITTGRYYTPSGRSIQARGIDPDIRVDQPLPDDISPLQVSIGGEASLVGHIEAPRRNRGEEKGAPNRDQAGQADNEAMTDDGAVPESAEAAAEASDIKGSPAYVPRDPEEDEQLQYALKLLRHEISNDKFIIPG